MSTPHNMAERRLLRLWWKADAPATLLEGIATGQLRQLFFGTVPGISLCQSGRGSGERAQTCTASQRRKPTVGHWREPVMNPHNGSRGR